MTETINLDSTLQRNNMKILYLSSSARQRGNTARILTSLQNIMEAWATEKDIVIQQNSIDLSQKDIRFCKGCRLCFNKGELACPLKDDLLAIRSQMLGADVLIIASPVYVNDMNGIMKNWIDRMAFSSHRPELAGKMVFLIATVAGSPTFQTLMMMGSAFSTWGTHILGKAGFKMGALMKESEIDTKFTSKLTKITKCIFQAYQNKRFLKPSFMSLMTFRIQQKAWARNPDKNNVDYQYWYQHGWLTPKAKFYIPIHSNVIKVGIARICGTILAKFMV